MTRYYILVDGKASSGTYTALQLRGQGIKPDDWVCSIESGDWVQARQVREIFPQSPIPPIIPTELETEPNSLHAEDGSRQSQDIGQESMLGTPPASMQASSTPAPQDVPLASAVKSILHVWRWHLISTFGLILLAWVTLDIMQCMQKRRIEDERKQQQEEKMKIEAEQKALQREKQVRDSISKEEERRKNEALRATPGYQLQQADSLLKSVQSQISQLEGEIKDLTSQHTASVHALTTAKDKLKKAKRHPATVKLRESQPARIGAAQSKIDSLNDVTTRLDKARDTKRTQLATMKEEAQRLHGVINSLTKQIESALPSS